MFLEKDWRPEHLRLTYEVWEDRIADAVIDGNCWKRAQIGVVAFKT